MTNWVILPLFTLFPSLPYKFSFSCKTVLLWINVGVRISLLLNLILFNTLNFFSSCALKRKVAGNNHLWCVLFCEMYFLPQAFEGGVILSIFHTRKPSLAVVYISMQLTEDSNISSDSSPNPRFLLSHQGLASYDSGFFFFNLGKIGL